jgi:hypothetical protein
MLTAINRVHLKAGPWASNGGVRVQPRADLRRPRPDRDGSGRAIA